MRGACTIYKQFQTNLTFHNSNSNGILFETQRCGDKDSKQRWDIAKFIQYICSAHIVRIKFLNCIQISAFGIFVVALYQNSLSVVVIKITITHMLFFHNLSWKI